MNDITETDYAEWLEEALRSLYQMEPVSIAIVLKDPEGNIGTTYFNCSVSDKTSMAAVIEQDSMFERLIINKEFLKQLIYRVEDEEDTEYDDEPNQEE